MENSESRALLVMGFFDGLLSLVRGRLNEALLASSAKWAKTIGHYALLVAAACGFVACLIAAIRGDSFGLFLAGIGWVALVLVLQYVAYRFADAGVAIVATSPTKVRSRAFLDCFALVSIILGILALVVYTVLAVRAQELSVFVGGLGAFIYFEYMAGIALNPRVTNLTVCGDIGAGEDAIGIMTFLGKGFLALVPIFFGYGLVLGALGEVIAVGKLV